MDPCEPSKGVMINHFEIKPTLRSLTQFLCQPCPSNTLGRRDQKLFLHQASFAKSSIGTKTASKFKGFSPSSGAALEFLDLPTTCVANYLGCQQPVLPTTHDRCLVRWSHYEKTNLLTVLTGPDVETGKYPKRNDLCKGKPSRKPYPPLESRFAMFLPRGFSAVKLGPQSPLGLTQCIATIGPIPDWPRIPLANKKSSLQPIPPCIDPIRLGFRGSAIFY